MNTIAKASEYQYTGIPSVSRDKSLSTARDAKNNEIRDRNTKRYMVKKRRCRKPSLMDFQILLPEVERLNDRKPRRIDRSLSPRGAPRESFIFFTRTAVSSQLDTRGQHSPLGETFVESEKSRSCRTLSSWPTLSLPRKLVLDNRRKLTVQVRREPVVWLKLVEEFLSRRAPEPVFINLSVASAHTKRGWTEFAPREHGRAINTGRRNLLQGRGRGSKNM